MRARTHELPIGVISDRRAAPRVPVEVECQAVTDDDFFLLSERISDLSSTGLMLRADGVPADVGEMVIVSFRPPRSDVWIDAQARIVRLLNGNEPGAPGFGLQLETLNAFDREVLRGAIERADPARKRRRRAPNLRRRRYADPDAVAHRPLITVGDAVTRLPPIPRPEPRPKRKERPIPRAAFADAAPPTGALAASEDTQAAPEPADSIEGAVVARIQLRQVAVARAETPVPRSLWRDEGPTASTPSVQVIPKRRFQRRLPNVRLQLPELPPSTLEPTTLAPLPHVTTEVANDSTETHEVVAREGDGPVTQALLAGLGFASVGAGSERSICVPIPDVPTQDRPAPAAAATAPVATRATVAVASPPSVVVVRTIASGTPEDPSIARRRVVVLD